MLPKIGCIVPKLGKTGGNLGGGGAPQTDGSAPVSYYWCQYLQRGRAGPLISITKVLQKYYKSTTKVFTEGQGSASN